MRRTVDRWQAEQVVRQIRGANAERKHSRQFAEFAS